jgi:uncharacterized protein (TIGR03067 family)
MRHVAVLTLALGLIGLTRADDKIADKYQGDWIVQSITKNGKPDDTYKGGTRVQEGHKYTLNPREGSKAPRAEGTFTVDTSKSPATYDMKPTSGRYKGQTLHGISKVEDNVLTICFAPAGKPRPTAFESKPGFGWVLAVHKRAK